MVFAMLEADANDSWRDSMPDDIKSDVETALAQSENGPVIPYEEIQKRYGRWLVK